MLLCAIEHKNLFYAVYTLHKYELLDHEKWMFECYNYLSLHIIIIEENVLPGLQIEIFNKDREMDV